jgi:hypothetical protein
MAGSAFSSRIVTQVKVDPVGVEVVRGLDDVIARKHFGGRATRRSLLFRGRIFGVRVYGKALEKG